MLSFTVIATAYTMQSDAVKEFMAENVYLMWVCMGIWFVLMIFLTCKCGDTCNSC